MSDSIFNPYKGISKTNFLKSSYLKKIDHTFFSFFGKKTSYLFPGYRNMQGRPQDKLGLLDYAFGFLPLLTNFAAYGLWRGCNKIFNSSALPIAFKIVITPILLLPALVLSLASFIVYAILLIAKAIMAAVLTIASLPIIGIIHAISKSQPTDHTTVDSDDYVSYNDDIVSVNSTTGTIRRASRFIHNDGSSVICITNVTNAPGSHVHADSRNGTITF